jgi:hypothetical protein
VEEESWFVEELTKLFLAAGWRIQRMADHDGIDLLASCGADQYVIDLKLTRESSRRSLTEGLLASAILRSRAIASKTSARPLAVLCASSISDGLLQELDEYVTQFGNGTAWGAMDRRGLAVFHGEGLLDIRRARRRVLKAFTLPHRSDLFSDRGQWMLKVLLSHRLPTDFRFVSASSTRIDRPVESASQLSKLSGVSTASAARHVSTLRDERFLVGGGELRLIRTAELLERWRSFRKPVTEIRSRWLFPPKDPDAHVERLVAKSSQRTGERAMLGLFAACDRLGFRFVSGVAPHVYLENISPEGIDRLGLRRTDPGESTDVFLRVPRFPESMFRGCASQDGVPVADVLQCWLDVAEHPARGEEMASHLYEQLIGPFLVDSVHS